MSAASSANKCWAVSSATSTSKTCGWRPETPDTQADAGQVLEALAQANERLIEFYEELKKRKAVRAVTHAFDLRHYDDQASFLGELVVDAELVTGRAACWSVSFSFPSERWLIVSEVRASAPGGQQVWRSFPDRTARTGNEFAEAIGAAVSELVNSLDSIDLIDVGA